jgi:hypothetical protein
MAAGERPMRIHTITPPQNSTSAIASTTRAQLAESMLDES